MNRFKRILVVVDPHRQQSNALNRAVSLALRQGVTVRGIDIVDRPPAPVLSVVDNAEDLYEREIAARKRHLDALVDPYRDGRIAISSELLRGRPATETIRYAIAGHYDVVIKDGDGNAANGAVYTGVDKRLIRQCPCPVWLVRSNYGGAFDHVAAAVDPQPASDTERKLNRRVLELASSIAKSENARLTVISIWRGSEELASLGSAYALPLAQLEARLEDDATRTLHEAVQQVDLDPDAFSLLFRRGQPGSTICKELEHSDVDLMVMGTVTRTGIAGLFTGNTAERVLACLRSSVLTIKPNGLVSSAEVGRSLADGFRNFWQAS